MQAEGTVYVLSEVEADVDVAKRMIFCGVEQIALQGKNHGSGGRWTKETDWKTMCDSQEVNKEWVGGEEDRRK